MKNTNTLPSYIRLLRDGNTHNDMGYYYHTKTDLSYILNTDIGRQYTADHGYRIIQIAVHHNVDTTKSSIEFTYDRVTEEEEEDDDEDIHEAVYDITLEDAITIITDLYNNGSRPSSNGGAWQCTAYGIMLPGLPRDHVPTRPISN